MAPGIMCFGRKSHDPDRDRNLAVERQLKAFKKQESKEVKLLLLGAGESGKSTVLKQMRVIHAGGFSKSERKQYRVLIFNNLVHAFQTILGAMEATDTYFEDESNFAHAQYVGSDPDIGPDDSLPVEAYHAFTSLWADRGVQLAMLKGHEFLIHDNLGYFLDDLDRLFARGFLPSDQDVLRVRLRTTGITETHFDLGNLKYRMFDVGGQRSERKKWIHVFDNVNVVLFLAAISGYDQGLIEDRNSNQMSEALMLFESIANSKYFQKSALILFLNKMDLFRDKISSGMSSLSRHFNDFTGRDDDAQAAQMFFADKFRNLVRDKKKEVYIHYTNATDTDLLKKTMQSVQDMIVQRNLNTLIL